MLQIRSISYLWTWKNVVEVKIFLKTILKNHQNMFASCLFEEVLDHYYIIGVKIFEKVKETFNIQNSF